MTDLLKYGAYASVSAFTIYGLVAVSRIIFQVVTAWLERKQTYRLTQLPMATLIVPAYNEEITAFEKAVASFGRQDYPRLETIVIDDGSDNSDALQTVCARYGIRYHLADHGGKREAMYVGFSLADPSSSVIVTGDSDTALAPNAVTNLIACLTSDPRIGAVTGYVAAQNETQNLLTRIVALRYWMAFNVERASQSYFGCVTCVSGPLGAYRRELIEQVKDKFVSQTFMGKQCTFGDDRHLTNLILGLGYKVKFSKAVAYTEVPATVQQFIKQQARWGKSHWREMVWQAKALPKQSAYLSYDFATTLLLPFLLTVSLVRYGYLSLETPIVLGYMGANLLGMSLIRVVPPLVETRNPWFLAFPVYSVFHLIVLLPLKFWSLATVNITAWGTRGERENVGLFKLAYTKIASIL